MEAVRNKEGLESSDLADQIDDVRLNLSPLSTEELISFNTPLFSCGAR
jgi:hypothetical protein